MDETAVQDIAGDFLVGLEAARRFHSPRPLVLIAHSLGGIVVMEALRRSSGCTRNQRHLHSIYEETSGILFFGTPHGSPDFRALIQLTIERVIIVDDFKVNDHVVNTFLLYAERLKEWNERFGSISRDNSWTIFSFQEQYGNIAISSKKVRVSSIFIECTKSDRLLTILLLV